MAKDMDSKEVAKILDRMEKERGYRIEFWELLAKYDPDFLKRYDELFIGTIKTGDLPEKYKHLIWCATAACALNEYSLEVHTKKAIEAGATAKELLETMEVAFFHGGAPVFLYAAKHVKAALKGNE